MSTKACLEDRLVKQSAIGLFALVVSSFVFCSAVGAQVTVSISSPTNGTSYTSPQTVRITAVASDSTTKVDFYDGTALLGEDNSSFGPDYTYDWAVTSVNNGQHSLTAVAYDDVGNNARSNPVTVNVNINPNGFPGSITITSPADGTTYTSIQTVTLTATVSSTFDPPPVVSFVQFWEDNRPSPSATIYAPPYNYNWPITAADNGTHRWRAVAFDTQGRQTSTSVTLTVLIGPGISITNPPDGSTFTAGSGSRTVELTAIVSEQSSIITVNDVYFQDNGGANLRATARNHYDALHWSFSYYWQITGVDAGTHNWTAQFNDDAGQRGTSLPVSVTVVADYTPPTVFIGSPSSGTVYTNPQSVTISAYSSDNIGVARVEFYDGTYLRGTSTTTPYNYVWTISSAADNGAHDWRVKAYDAAGNSTLSSVVTLNVDIAAPAITTQPQSQSVFAGSNVTLTVGASGHLPLNFQWRLNNINLVDGGVISGATSAILTISNVQPANAGDYSVLVTNLAGSVTSSNAHLTVNPRRLGTVIEWGPDYVVSTAPQAAQSGVTAIAAGDDLTVALKNDGSVLAWGPNNDDGQLTVPVAAQSGVTAIAAEWYHAVALKNDGSVLAWGDNRYGQSTVPMAAQSGVTAIAAGYGHTVALKNDGSVLAWGANYYGQSTVPMAAQNGVTAIAAGTDHTVALKGDGSVTAWGDNHYGQSTVPMAAQSGVTAIAAGAYHTVALKSDGSVLAWGYNYYGQSTVPMAAQSGVTALAAGYGHTVALKNDGSVVAWGDNSYGQSTVPMAAQNGVTAIAAGTRHTVALLGTGVVDLDIGLRAYDGVAIIYIACEAPDASGQLTSPIRVTKNGTTYGILLTETNSTGASKFRIQTSTGVKALKKLP